MRLSAAHVHFTRQRDAFWTLLRISTHADFQSISNFPNTLQSCDRYINHFSNTVFAPELYCSPTCSANCAENSTLCNATMPDMYAFQAGPKPTTQGTQDNKDTPSQFTPNVLPCRVHHDGPVDSLERFWAPASDSKGTICLMKNYTFQSTYSYDSRSITNFQSTQIQHRLHSSEAASFVGAAWPFPKDIKARPSQLDNAI